MTCSRTFSKLAFVFFLVLCYFSFLNSQAEDFTTEQMVRRIRSHLVIKNPQGAVEEAEFFLLSHPYCSDVYEEYIKALSDLGDEKKMIMAFDDYLKHFPEKIKDRALVEGVAWGVLHKTSHSQSFIMREMTLLAALFSEDAKGVTILHEGLTDSNYAIRSVAVKLAGHLRDHTLKEDIKRLVREEKILSVRKQAICACGHMQLKEMQDVLKNIISSNESSLEEKLLAISSLLEMASSINDLNVDILASSPCLGLRVLAAEAILYFQGKEHLSTLIKLAEDPHSDVRLSAIQALGLIRSQENKGEIIEIARKKLQDSSIKVSLSAAWVLTLYVPEEGKKILQSALSHPEREVRLLSASALSVSAHFGKDILQQELSQAKDPYVRLNLARGAIGQRIAEQEALREIKEILLHETKFLRMHQVGIFSYITPDLKKSYEENSFPPETEDKLIRLDLLNDLAMRQSPEAKEAILQYLNERSVEVSASAALSLLTEGDESSIELVRHLLNVKDPKIKLQAALILSMWSREESTLQVLEEAYGKSSTELKMRILEGIGRIGSMQSLPFLISVLKEQSETIRLIAAVSIIQCVNH